ncbi:tetratricopeptide repeat protein [Flaviaesturariibacter flavus]|uniref:Tetratricopeptide repeat protein n=1 Tax=Flaviaesturariibacter flavus TaxID=2502780 RepID=A0A4R1BAP0_9BACT|nr:tetratricopeptide repeat protein [Flaviaesturariibacter flavus]TCJ14046.1 tetratricopeptide repeat protein [Flaviaesturariibacter flavus]
MKKQQWTVLGIVALLTIGIYALTQSQIFGSKAPKGENTGSTVHGPGDGHDHDAAPFTTDTLLARARQQLAPAQRARLALLESSISRGDVQGQKEHLYHQLAAFWRDSARLFEPYAWYTGEAARLENSEKTLTFAAHLFLNSLREEEDPALKSWKALQAKDLFERSLQIAPANDSSQVGLGSVILYGGLGSPMDGIAKIRAVADRDSTNAYAQMTLGEASLMSGQTDKAIDRFERVVRLQPNSPQAVLLLADVHERAGHKADAVRWYRRSLQLVLPGAVKAEVERRIAELNK